MLLFPIQWASIIPVRILRRQFVHFLRVLCHQSLVVLGVIVLRDISIGQATLSLSKGRFVDSPSCLDRGGYLSIEGWTVLFLWMCLVVRVRLLRWILVFDHWRVLVCSWFYTLMVNSSTIIVFLLIESDFSVKLGIIEARVLVYYFSRRFWLGFLLMVVIDVFVIWCF